VIGVVFGTSAEAIKLAPLIHELTRRGHPPLVMCTAQQAEQIPEFLEDLGLRPPDLWLARGHRGADLERMRHLPAWGATAIGRFLRHRRRIERRLRSDGHTPALIVQGDTMTTVLGALAGRALGVQVGHLEAGLRSGDIFQPWPEELNRRVADRLAHVNFAPNAEAASRLRASIPRVRVVDTGGNTIEDALHLAERAAASSDQAAGDFGLVSLHRQELLGSRQRLAEALEILHEHSRRERLLFVDHSITSEAIRAHGLEHLFDARFRRIPRLRYLPFIALLKRSRFLVTDSGGSHAECALLGHPCLVHRAVTEQADGIGGCVVLSRMDPAALRDFLSDPDRHRTPPARSDRRPTDAVVEELERIGAVPVPARAPAPSVR
jgi:UDP-N-acetylglucosamine 2-epimerase (non-hydrolysing)